MSLPLGTRFGAYEVTGTLGAGGMGEVYRAHDARLDRDVAIKILPEVFTSDADRIARFEREARVLASLNHQNIAAIYGVEEGVSETGRAVRGLVLELIEGETLGERLARRPLPLADTLDVARQIVDALETAHERGIVHRDLKPANISITPEGTVKVLDFGLAKSDTSESANLSHLTTAMADGTREGVILGTAAYMSPEQARGQMVDRRTDIWAFGCVLFEMLTGRVAFDRPTMTDTLAAIVEREPQWDLLPGRTPVSIQQLLKACLVKDAKRRLRDIGDARFSLTGVDLRDAASSGVPRGWSKRQWVAATGVGIVVVAGSVALGMSLRRPVASANSQPVRLAVPPPPDTQFANDVERIAYALSPDGSQLGFVADKQGATSIWMRPLSSDSARPIAGTEGARSFMWSPNGNAIAFFAGDKLKRIDLGGGVPVVVCDAPSGVGIYGSWSANNEIVFASIEGDAIYKVSATGGTPTPIVKPDLSRGESRVVWPSFLPDGQRFVFVTRFKEGPGQLSVGGDGRAPRHIAPLFSPAQWVDPHYLVFAREGTLVAQRFDTATERLVGQPVPIADSVEHTVATYKAGFSASRSGNLVYQPSFDVDHLAWVDRTGAEAGTVGTPGYYQSLRLSRGSTRLMFDRVDPHVGTHDIWILDLQRGTEDRITSGTSSEAWPVWIDAERAVVFMAALTGPPNLFRKDLASGREQQLIPVSTLQQATDVSPDERTLAFMQRSSRGHFDIWTLSLTGASTPMPLLTTAFNEVDLRFSPDGRAMAWTSDEVGTSEVYVASLLLSEAKIRVSRNGGRQPRWSHDGRELFYLAADGRIMAVPVHTNPKPTVGTPIALFTATGRGWRHFEVAASGQFIAIVRDIAASAQPLNVVLNWTAGVGG